MGLIRPKMTRLFSQNVASQINYARIIVRRSWVTRELDGMRGAGQSYTDSLGERHWIRCDETNCRSHRRGNDYVDHSRIGAGPSFLCLDEGTISAAWHLAVWICRAEVKRVQSNN
jgi:hypothetical protein